MGDFSEVFAEENPNGGQVTTEGIVTFYEEQVDSSSQTQESKEVVEKPKGRLPSTGEVVKSLISIVGMILVGYLLLVVAKRKKKKEGES